MGQLLEKVIWDQRTSSFLSVYFIRCAGKDSPRHGKSILRCVCGIRVSNSIGSWEWLLSFWPSGFVSVGITSMLYHTWLKIRVQDSQHARQALYHLSTSPAHRGFPSPVHFSAFCRQQYCSVCLGYCWSVNSAPWAFLSLLAPPSFRAFPKSLDPAPGPFPPPLHVREVGVLWTSSWSHEFLLISAQSVTCSWRVVRLVDIKVLCYDLNLKCAVSWRLDCQ